MEPCENRTARIAFELRGVILVWLVFRRQPEHPAAEPGGIVLPPSLRAASERHALLAPSALYQLEAGLDCGLTRARWVRMALRRSLGKIMRTKSLPPGAVGNRTRAGKVPFTVRHNQSRRTAPGVPPKPGFTHLITMPHPMGDLKFVKAAHRSPCVIIASEWQRHGTQFDWQLPGLPNTMATAPVPAAELEMISEGRGPARTARGVKSFRFEKRPDWFEIESGSYRCPACIPMASVR